MSKNGQLLPSELVSVDGWGLANSNLANAYNAAKLYIFKKFNVIIVVSQPDGFYRSLARQVIVKQIYGKIAATPGYSTHGLGLAFDINNIGTISNAVGGLIQLDAIMARFGLVRDAGNGAGGIEQWHYRLVAVVNILSVATGTKLEEPIKTPNKENEMKAVQLAYVDANNNTHRAIVVPGTSYFLAFDDNDATLANQIAASLNTGSAIVVSLSMFTAFQNAAAAMK